MIKRTNSVEPNTAAISKGIKDGSYAGKVIAISKETGEVIEKADDYDELKHLMHLRYPNCDYRALCCPN